MLYVILFFIIAVCVLIIHLCTKSNGQLLIRPENHDLQYFCIKDSGYYVSVWPKNQKIGEYIEFEIAGITYRKNIDKYLGEFVGTLKPEPNNPYDANAIKILAEDGHHVGYVPKDMTAEVRKHTSLPCKCFFYIGENDGTYYSDCYIKIQL
ncbi:MAG: HIRAN domain-containing protein [Bacteroidaceae bacterium]|nr:HIRAN domain-containing protein [Bacteroidaceae bacterium]